jgi:hypothetical protein
MPSEAEMLAVAITPFSVAVMLAFVVLALVQLARGIERRHPMGTAR